MWGQVRVGRTLLSDAFDFAVDLDFAFAFDFYSAMGAPTSRRFCETWESSPM